MSAVNPTVPAFAMPPRPATAYEDALDAPMSRSQAWELLYLSQRAEQPSLFDESLSAQDAAARIARLRLQLDG